MIKNLLFIIFTLCITANVLSASLPAGIIKLTDGVFANGGQALGIAMQSDGKIVVCGYTLVGGQTRWTVARFKATGFLDRTFGTNGVVQSSVDGSKAAGLILQPDQKIVVIGTTVIAGFSRAQLIRYNADGTISGSGADQVLLGSTAGVGIAVATNGTTIITCNSIVSTQFLFTKRNISSFTTTDNSFQIALGTTTYTFNTGSIIYTSSGSVKMVSSGATNRGSIADTNNSQTGASGAFSYDMRFPGALVIGGGTNYLLTNVSDTMTIRSSANLNSSSSSLASGSITPNSNSTSSYPSYGKLAFAADVTKFLACGCSTSSNSSGQPFIARRLVSDASADTTFGSSGITIQSTTEITPGTYSSLGVQSNGYAVVVGMSNYSGDGGERWILARYDTSGQLDPTFGSIDYTGVLQDTASPFNTTDTALLYSTTVAQDTTLLAAAQFDSNWYVINYLDDGTRNTSFGPANNGIAEDPSFSGTSCPYATATDTLGRIIAVGSSVDGGEELMTVVRYDADGSIDTIVQEDTLGQGAALGVTVYADNSFSVVGYVDAAGNASPIVLDYDANGTRTTVRQFDDLIPGKFYSLQVSDGKEYAAGESDSAALFYALLDGTGLLQDTAAPFNTGQPGQIYGGMIDEDDRITFCGTYNNTWMLVRYTAVGERDVTFGPNGNGVILDTTFNPAAAYALTQDASGNYLVTGQITVNGTAVLGLAKYTQNGIAIPSFGSNGMTQGITFGQSQGRGISITDSGTIVVAGQSTSNATLYPTLFTYNADGSLVTQFGTNGVQQYQIFGAGTLYAPIDDQTAVTTAGDMGSVATITQVGQDSTAAATIASGL